MSEREPPSRPQLPGSVAWKPAEYTLAEAAAVRAVAHGAANEDQQRLAMKYIVETLAGLYDLEFRPGSDGARESAFAGGKRFVGLQIVKLVNHVIRSEANEQSP